MNFRKVFLLKAWKPFEFICFHSDIREFQCKCRGIKHRTYFKVIVLFLVKFPKLRVRTGEMCS